jgi:hypothetical protein
MKILVVGGAGYIGSHMVKRLGQLGCRVTTLDDLSSGHLDAVLNGDFVQGSIVGSDLLDRLLGPGYDAVMHFASFIQIGESVQQPAKYYQNNVVNKQLNGGVLRHEGSTLAHDMFARYFLQHPPFEQKKKSEFPDAASLLLLEEFAVKNNTQGILISKDGGWSKFAKQSERLY